MRKISNIKNKKLREEQFGVLIDVLQSIKSKSDLCFFLEHFLSESEKAYLSQRLNIMRMLAKNFSYSQIKYKINATTATITNSHNCLEKGGEKLFSLLLSYRFEENKSKDKILPKMPGAIDLSEIKFQTKKKNLDDL